jgi:pyruvate ferredoxin oxidoreductase gamma subunit/2-oxoisovalerate ferredoxin oxidoreductase gamma subunit
LLFEVRWHGRGGQGIVTVSRLLAQAALLDGMYIQAFPEFGPERRGAPITGYTRISDEPIDIHSHIYNPNVVVIVDPTLLGKLNITKGLVEDGTVVVHTDMKSHELKRQLKIEKAKVFKVNAKRIALDILGKPIYNTALLGALVKATSLVTLQSVYRVVAERFSGVVGEKNIAIIKKSYEETLSIE